jgi:predicted metal-dependent hydrolase
MMRLEYQYGTERIEFELEYSKRRTLSIQVNPPREITVVAPLGKTEEEILQAVKGKSRWIVQKLYEIREIEHRRSRKEYVNGESFLYLGRNHSLDIVVDRSVRVPEAKLFRGRFVVRTPSRDEDHVRKALRDWYRDKAKEKVTERVDYYLGYFDPKPRRIVIKDQDKRWGSCTRDNELLFNWKVVMAPAPVLDYIVVHEMCHMVHRNHSRDFWQLLGRILPDYEKRKEWLRNNGIKFEL